MHQPAATWRPCRLAERNVEVEWAPSTESVFVVSSVEALDRHRCCQTSAGCVGRGQHPVGVGEHEPRPSAKSTSSPLSLPRQTPRPAHEDIRNTLPRPTTTLFRQPPTERSA